MECERGTTADAAVAVSKRRNDGVERRPCQALSCAAVADNFYATLQLTVNARWTTTQCWLQVAQQRDTQSNDNGREDEGTYSAL